MVWGPGSLLIQRQASCCMELGLEASSQGLLSCCSSCSGLSESLPTSIPRPKRRSDIHSGLRQLLPPLSPLLFLPDDLRFLQDLTLSPHCSRQSSEDLGPMSPANLFQAPSDPLLLDQVPLWAYPCMAEVPPCRLLPSGFLSAGCILHRGRRVGICPLLPCVTVVVLHLQGPEMRAYALSKQPGLCCNLPGPHRGGRSAGCRIWLSCTPRARPSQALTSRCDQAGLGGGVTWSEEEPEQTWAQT